MRSKENYRQFTAVALGLTLAIIITFQIYIWREPGRIRADEEADHDFAVSAGGLLYQDNCAACHGDEGQGGVGPPLNSKELLSTTPEDALSSLTQTGVPSTIMPAWGQAFGGPLTDEEVGQVAKFLQAWEPTAPSTAAAMEEPDPVRGATIYAQTCAICHGQNGQGSDLAPALNDMERLQNLGDAWYRSTIARGRPAKGMPTWGTVLSPQQIGDLVSLIAAWRAGETVSASIPLASLATNALFAIRDFDQADAKFFLNSSRQVANAAQREEIDAIIALVEKNSLFEAQRRLVSLLPPEEMGKALFSSNCAPCHGDDGSGGMGPSLLGNNFVQLHEDEELIAFILAGRPGTAMDGFEGIIAPEELANLVALLRSWQD